LVLVRVISQRVCWLAFVVDVDREDVSDASVAEAVGGVDGRAVRDKAGVVDAPMVVEGDGEEVLEH